MTVVHMFCCAASAATVPVLISSRRNGCQNIWPLFPPASARIGSQLTSYWSPVRTRACRSLRCLLLGAIICGWSDSLRQLITSYSSGNYLRACHPDLHRCDLLGTSLEQRGSAIVKQEVVVIVVELGVRPVRRYLLVVCGVAELICFPFRFASMQVGIPEIWNFCWLKLKYRARLIGLGLAGRGRLKFSGFVSRLSMVEPGWRVVLFFCQRVFCGMTIGWFENEFEFCAGWFWVDVPR